MAQKTPGHKPKPGKNSKSGPQWPPMHSNGSVMAHQPAAIAVFDCLAPVQAVDLQPATPLQHSLTLIITLTECTQPPCMTASGHTMITAAGHGMACCSRERNCQHNPPAPDAAPHPTLHRRNSPHRQSTPLTAKGCGLWDWERINAYIRGTHADTDVFLDPAALSAPSNSA